MLDISALAPRDAFPAFVPEMFARADDSDRNAAASFTGDRSATLIEILDLACAAVSRLESARPDSKFELDARRWIALIQARDEAGLRSLHAALGRRVLSCALRIVRCDEMAHEIVSTTFMQVWNNAAHYEAQRGTAVAWVLLIARTRALDALRHANVRKQYEVRSEDEESSAQFDTEALLDPLAHLERRRRRLRLQRAMSRLSPIQRQVLSLTTLEGLSQDEASRHLNLPLGTIKSHTRRGLAALKRRCEATGLSWD